MERLYEKLSANGIDETLLNEFTDTKVMSQKDCTPLFKIWEANVESLYEKLSANGIEETLLTEFSPLKTVTKRR